MVLGNILLVEDNADLRESTLAYFEMEGYSVEAVETLKEALEKTKDKSFDVVLLDLNLPDGKGINLINQFNATTDTSIIIISGVSNTTEKIVCLEMGADDYIVKPYNLREVSARITAIMRCTKRNKPQKTDAEENINTIIYFGDGLYLNRNDYQAYNSDDVSINLTTGEFKLLEALLISVNRAVSRENLFDLTHDDEYQDCDRAVDVQIGRLRKKINDTNPDSPIIETVRGVGYMFCKD